MLKSYKYRIYPNTRQTELLNKHFGCCRFVYNWALGKKRFHWQEYKASLSRSELQYQLVNWLKKSQEYQWLNEVYAQSLLVSLQNVDTAYQNFFKYGSGFPKFKSKHKKQSCSFPQGTKIDFDNNFIQVPKIGRIKAVISRKFKGYIKTTTITKMPTGKYFISILVDNKEEVPTKPNIKKDTTIGIDVGIKDFLILSDGTIFKNHKHLYNAEQRLKVLQRRLSKKQKGSNNRDKARIKLAKQHEKIKNKRLDNIHKITTHLINESQVESFVVEDFNVSGLLKNHKLAKSISDVSWGEFYRILEYKCRWYGKNFIKVDRFEPSTKMCSKCGFINHNLKLSDRKWECPKCGAIHNRDKNAAQNIKRVGLKKTGAGCSGEPVESSPLGGAKKQEIV